MAKRYKNPVSPPLPPGTPVVEKVDVPVFHERVLALVDAMLADGCPCRYPRLRAMVADEPPAPWVAQDQQVLIAAFDERVPLEERETHPLGHRGRCAHCGASVVRWAAEVFKDSWIERLTVEPAAAADLGASMSLPLPHVLPFYAAAPLDGATRDVPPGSPRVGVERWLAWLAERR